jgi:hypothetical protein
VASELLRVPNRPDLAGQLERMLMLRTSTGLLPPRVKSLADADVEAPGDGFLRASIAIAGTAGQVVQVWACSLTRDRVPSRVVGPFRVTIPGGA